MGWSMAIRAALTRALTSQDWIGIMFNDDQVGYMRDIAAKPLAEKCWCAWFKLGECPHCPLDKSAADRAKVECPICHNYPPPTDPERPVIHRIGCSNRDA